MVGGRTGGKTIFVLQAAVKRSLEQGRPLAVTSEKTKDMILQVAAGQGVEIPEPVVVNLHDRYPRDVTFAGIIIDRTFWEENIMERNEFFYKKLNRKVKEMLAPVRMGVMVLNADGSGDGDILIAAMIDELQTMKLYRDENEAALDRELGEGGEGKKCVAYTDFGTAIRAVKEGYRIARKGWNGKSQYIELATRVSYIAADGSLVNVDHAAAGNAALAFVGTSGVQLGWLASQADMLAEDWYILEDAK